MKRFLVPANGTGKSFGMVAGAHCTHQKKNLVAVGMIDIEFEYQVSALTRGEA